MKTAVEIKAEQELAQLRSGEPWDPSGRPCSTGYTVGIPEVDEAQSRVELHAVVEEIDTGAFQIDGGAPASHP